MTIIDIAKESGYSVSTVSRVLNNRRDVSPEAQKRIMEIVKAHNFVPNNNAKRLKQTVTKNILILVKGTSNMLFAGIIEEIQHFVEKTDYTVSVYYLDETDNEVMEADRLCRERKPMGILFLGGNPQFFDEGFERITIPCVLVTNQANNMGFDNLSSVATDDVSASEKVIDYLYEQGHRDIAVIGGDLSASHTSLQRFTGCKKSFQKHDIDFEKDICYIPARFSFASAYQAMNHLLDMEKPITAVFAMSDVMAIGAIRAIRDRGMQVPEDISIVGFDGVPLADYYNPKLATVRQEYQTIAVRSVEILLKVIGLQQSAIHEIIPFSFTCGESVKRIK